MPPPRTFARLQPRNALRTVFWSTPSALPIARKLISRRERDGPPSGSAAREPTYLESRNGTYYLGQRLGRMVLRPGSRIRVGNAEIEIDIDRDALFRLDGDAQAYRGLVLCSRNTSPPAREARSFLAE